MKQTERDNIVQLEWIRDARGHSGFEGVVIDVKRGDDFRCRRVYLKRDEALDVARKIIARFES